MIIWIAWSHCDYVVKIPRRYHGQDWTNIFWWSHLRYILSPYAGILIWISSIIKWYNWCCNMKCDPQFGQLMHCFILIQNNWLMLIICRVSQRWCDTERRESSTILIIDVEHCTRSLYKKLINKGFGDDKDSYSFSLVNIQNKLKNILLIWTLFIWTAFSSDFD